MLGSRYTSKMILGLLILTLGAFALIPLESWIHRNLSGVSDVLAEHVYLPLARIALIIGFLYAIFPSPMLSADVLGQLPPGELGTPAWKSLLNVLFVVGLILPLFPETQKFGAVILPVQTLIGVWIFVGHLEDSSGLELHISGGNSWMLPFAAALIASHVLLRTLSQAASRRWALDALSLYDAIVLAVQPPLALMVSRAFVVVN